MDIHNIDGTYLDYRAHFDTMDSNPSSSSRDSRDSRDTASVSPPLSVTASPRTFHNLELIATEGLVGPGISAMSLNFSPLLRVVEQPTEKSRFRYLSEAKGVHGAIMGRASTKIRKTYPAVELLNYTLPAVVRCSLFSAEDDASQRGPTFHRLVAKTTEGGRTLKDEPHTFPVNVHGAGNQVCFAGMSIIHTAKEHKLDELVRKTQCRTLEKRQQLEGSKAKLTLSEKFEISRVSKEKVDSGKLNNVVTLCFECFNEDQQPICEPVFSTPIFNQKSAMTNELRISRIDKHASSCLGQEEVYMLVEKVGKKNIKVRFFELNEDEEEVWSDFANFSEFDVHHQFAIVFRTPPYRSLEIESSKDVFVQLYRPSDGAKSDPREFKYTPKENRSERLRKVARRSTETAETGEAAAASDPMISNGLESLASFPSISPSIEEFLNADLSLMADLLPESNGENSWSFDSRLGMDLVSDSASGPCKKTTAGIKGKAVDEARGRKASNEEDSSRDELLAKVQKGCQEVKKLRSKATGRISDTLQDLFQLRATDGDTAVHVAVETGDLLALTTLVSEINLCRCAEILDHTNDSNKTALHLAVELDQWEMVSALLEGGASPDVTNGIGRTALHVAVDLSHARCVDQLLGFKGRKPDLEARDDHGWTALHVSILRASTQTARKLCVAGADADAADGRRKRTPLHFACDEENTEIARFLVLEAAVDFRLKDAAGVTARDIALARGCTEILAILPEEQDADPLSDGSDSEDRDFEDAESNPSDSESSRDADSSPMFDADTMSRLCAELDSDHRWQRLADKLGFGFVVNGIDGVASPARALINYAELRGCSVDELRSSLQELEEREAMLIIDSNRAH